MHFILIHALAIGGRVQVGIGGKVGDQISGKVSGEAVHRKEAINSLKERTMTLYKV